MTVSVIVPVYNVEPYLDKCVQSIMNQTLKEIEIILVDDGSPDQSGVMCDGYLQKDERIRVIHKENGGLSSARNAGFQEARGEFVLFIDSDDYIDPFMVETLYQNAILHQVDMSVCGIYNVYKQHTTPQCDVEEEFVCDAKEAYRLIMIGEKIPGSICNKLMKRELITDIRFPEGCIFEDAFFTTKLMQIVNRVYVTTKPMYYYFHREGSITTSSYNKKVLDCIRAYQKNIKVVDEKFPTIHKEAEFRLCWAYFNVLDIMLQDKHYMDIPELHSVVSFLKKHVLFIMKSPYFRKKRKIAAALVVINIRLYWLCLRLLNQTNKGLL